MYDVIWESPSDGPSGSMPLGNGDIGLNVWFEPSGDLVFYISKSDAWDENCRFVKVGRIRVKLSPNPLTSDAPFTQTLRLSHGAIEISVGDPGLSAALRVWVDANQPVVHVDVKTDYPCDARVELELWRTERRALVGSEIPFGQMDDPNPVYSEADTILPAVGDRVIWYHRNPASIWADTMTLQAMAEWMEKDCDPLLHRTFGGLLQGDGMHNDGSTAIASGQPRTNHEISIVVHTEQTSTPEDWKRRIEDIAVNLEQSDVWAAHVKWWEEFWDRSWIHVSGPGTEDISRGYTLQRFISACAGRGAFPIKFNGSLFNVDSNEPDETYNADYRRWGGPYWFQNTRLIYWPMPASGDYEMMRPLFTMIRNAMPFYVARTREYFGHEGAFFPETQYFWGTYANDNYGRNRNGHHKSLCLNESIRWHFNGTLEFIALMLDYYAHTRDDEFLKSELLPMADELLAFWDNHWDRDENGKLHMEPSQALETWQNCTNPAQDVAGLQWVLDGLLRLPDESLGAERSIRWTRLRSEAPPLPMTNDNGTTRLLAAEAINSPVGNWENPELYSVFPFRIYGVGKPDVEVARETYAHRANKRNVGWSQDETQAAFLGLTDEASNGVGERLRTKHPGSRFPAFWGPNDDWIPDQDHGGNALMALQTMLLQADNGKILLLPAWPKEWGVDFKLHAPHNTVVEGVYHAGKMEKLAVYPESRMDDVVFCMKGAEEDQ